MSKKTVLLVDDEESIRESIGKILTLKGFNVIQAENGIDAFDIIKKQEISFVISDVRMPKCDGATLLTLIKEYNSKIPVVIITGFSDISTDDLLKKGASSVLLKPFRIKTLFEVIEKL
jgi:DNA-binding NtrC family response regulator